MAYLEVKALHIVLVVSWFAGLFYLPRLFVNLAMVAQGSVAERERLLLMAGKLYRFMTPIGVLALASGLWLWLVVGIGGAWLHAKLVLVLALLVYNLYCRKLLTEFEAGHNRHGHVWFRWFNEVPAIILLLVTLLVVLKPF
jgi:protoporphyrinogen IX oxidase